MNNSQPPPAPDPVKTAQAATEQNIKTATAQTGLNAMNQTTPYGSLTYSQNGTWSDGTPRFSATTTLSPEEQKKQNQQWEFDYLTNQLGIDQTKKLAGLLSQPVNLNNDATEARLLDLGSKRLDPMFTQRQNELETKLYNQGVMPGTEAYGQAMAQFGRDRNDAYNQLLLSGRGQAVQEALSERNQPINEITALMSGGQVSQPNFINTPQSQVAPVDYAGLVNNNYAAQMAAYNANQAKQGALYGALGSLGGMALGGWGSGGGWKKMFG